MSGGLLLKDVVDRAVLERRTARYVLDHAQVIDIPSATGQGQHRRFSVDEAIRLALCCRLVMVGVALASAEVLTKWCETYWRQRTKGQRGHEFLFEAHVNHPWRISVVNGRNVKLLRDSPSRSDANFDDVYYDILDQREIADADDLRPDHTVIYWSLTHMALRIAKEQ